ncbi:MAG TPA: hypothetical protein H9881_05970 [Candidatus Stackebrandtia excrementipullorum]|nr:hypothetical protein [Candidatus Stackebrandtia excrementipullorum]
MTNVWYVSYGSNISTARFDCYVRGGTPAGGRYRYGGCRDRTPPVRQRPVFIDGGIYFAKHSLTWGGGIAFLDPAVPGRVAARAWLITLEQFADVCAQEMRAEIGTVQVPLNELRDKGSHAYGPGHYETLLHAGDLEGRMMLTFTAPERITPETAPTQAYVDTIADGLQETHGWSSEEARRYLDAARPHPGIAEPVQRE